MGLCKCHNVTNLFCFEHRTNVCEKCMTEAHAHCAVNSYLQWLQDSDYSTKCTVCDASLKEGPPTIRLKCLHLFHKPCLDQICDALPTHTAAAGYACPTCHLAIIPPAKDVGPLARRIRESFAASTWAKPLLSIEEAPLPPANAAAAATAFPAAPPSASIPNEVPSTTGQIVETVAAPPKPVVSRKLPPGSIAIPMTDDDDDKYKTRRVELPGLLRVFGYVTETGEPRVSIPRVASAIILVLILIVVYFTSSSKTATAN